MERQQIRGIKDGSAVNSIFLVAEASRQEAKNGPFWKLGLKDMTGSIEARLWSPAAKEFSGVAEGQYVRVRAKAQSYNGVVQLNIDDVKIVPETEIDPADYVKTSAIPPERLLSMAMELIDSELAYKPWKDFARKVLNDQVIRERFPIAPAAQSMHHAYRGGLLEHSLSVARLCLKITDAYPSLDRQLLCVAALFHDIGKLDEMSVKPGGGTEYTDEGRLIGHLVGGVLKLRPFLRKAKVDGQLALHFEHLILSHHGKPEFGAARTPLTAEALVLHHADDLDAKLAMLKESFDGVERDGGSAAWSAYMKAFEGSMCAPGRTPEPEIPVLPVTRGTQGSLV